MIDLTVRGLLRGLPTTRSATPSLRTVILLLLYSVLAGCGLHRQQVTEFQYIDGCYFSARTASSTKADNIQKDFVFKKPCTINSDMDVEDKQK